MMAFIAQLRELVGGKPVGFKICIGDPREFMAIVKAMIQTGIYADFIVVDGGEGGTGAAPLEFSDSLGAPLQRGPASSCRTPSSAPACATRSRSAPAARWSPPRRWRRSMALGADWCNSARAFMFAVGCIQSQRCHTNKCPVGVTTQDPKLQRALIVPDKAERVHNYHRNTVHALAEMIAAMGLDHTSELSPHHVVRRVTQFQALALDEIYDLVEPGELLEGTARARFQGFWDPASAESFRPWSAAEQATPLTGAPTDGRRAAPGGHRRRRRFGGLFAAKFLRRAPVQVTLVDRRNYHLFHEFTRRISAARDPGSGSSTVTTLVSLVGTAVLTVDPVPWARSQMAFTLAFHIILVPLGVSWAAMALIANYRGIKHDDATPCCWRSAGRSTWR